MSIDNNSTKVKSTDHWKTPDWLMNHFKNHYDPCPYKQDLTYYDGLKEDWNSPAYVNPPYSNPLSWVEKALEQQRKGVDIVMLLRVDVSTKFYKKIMEIHGHVVFFNERLKFSESNQSPNFSSMLVYLEGYKGVDSYV